MPVITLNHIAGATFGLTLSANQCPVVDPSGDPVDMADWKVDLRLINKSLRIDVPGKWLSSISPWSIFFESKDSHAWLPGAYECRIVYTEPAPESRRFEVPTEMALEVTR